MIKSDANFINSSFLLLISGGVFSIAFWLVDSAIDFYLLDEGDSFSESVFTPEPAELWMRCLVIAMMVFFSFFARKLFNSQQRANEQLTQYQNQLEQLVEERTKNLEEINTTLQEEIAERKNAEERLEYLATTDPLTLLYNRRKFDELMEYELERDKRYQSGLSIIFCDIDHFKKINDMHGHDVGDDVLRELSAEIRTSLRQSDIVARWGGEEFIILIPNCTADTAVTIAENIRKKIETYKFNKAGKVTASFGVTHVLGHDDKTTLIKRVDKALYAAKENGRNRVESIVQ